MSSFYPPHLKDIFFLNRIIDKGIFFHCSKILFLCLLTSIIPLERKAVNSFVLITLLCFYSLFFFKALFFLLWFVAILLWYAWVFLYIYHVMVLDLLETVPWCLLLLWRNPLQILLLFHSLFSSLFCIPVIHIVDLFVLSFLSHVLFCLSLSICFPYFGLVIFYWPIFSLLILFCLPSSLLLDTYIYI